MNFLSHYKVGKGYDSPDRTLGKILPDLIRSVDKRLRITHKSVEDLPQQLQELSAGIELHLQTDVYFHNSAWFQEKERYIKKSLAAMPLPKRFKYRYFFAHVLVEMLLDRVVMKQEPQLLDGFYHSLSGVEKATLTHYFQYKGWDAHLDKCWQVLQRFLASQYLYQYTDNAQLLYALGRVAQRVDLELFAEPYKTQLMHRINDMELFIAKDAGAIFEAIENHLVT